MPLTHEVVKSIVTPEGRKIAGELVDPSGWGMPARRLTLLTEQRHLRPIAGNVIPVPTVDGRFWVSTDWARKYGLQLERPPRKAEVAGAAPTVGQPDDEGGGDAEEVSASAPAPSVEPPDASPAAVRLAGKHGIDLSTITGTGAGGRILKSDVSALIGE